MTYIELKNKIRLEGRKRNIIVERDKKYVEDSYIVNKSKKGSITVEMSYILPIAVFLIFLLIHTAFFYHDKAVLCGAAAETVEQAVEYARVDRNDVSLESFFRGRISNKLIFLDLQSVNVSVSGSKINVVIKAGKWKFSSTINIQGNVPYPEKKLRIKQKLREEN